MKLDVTDIPMPQFTLRACVKRLEAFHVKHPKLNPRTEPTIIVITPAQQDYMSNGLGGEPWKFWRWLEIEVQK